MYQTTKTEHVLQMRERGSSWVEAVAGMYDPARTLARTRCAEMALQAAVEIRIENYGSMNGIEFRVVTTTRTVTTLAKLDDCD